MARIGEFGSRFHHIGTDGGRVPSTNERYSDIAPYDANRVHLHSSLKSLPAGADDYINARYDFGGGLNRSSRFKDRLTN